jgi:FAD/FMN-containing dehydrogenase
MGPVSTHDDVVSVVRRARDSGKRVKVVGTGHSFSGIARPEEVVLSLSNLRGIVSIDRTSATAVVNAGTTIADLNLELDRHGFAMPNLGDVTYQSIVGALSTSTHGTGINHGGLATQIQAFTLVTSSGEILKCSPTSNDRLWGFGRVSLGALGVIVDVTLNVVPKFALEAVEYPEPIDDVISAHPMGADQAQQQNRSLADREETTGDVLEQDGDGESCFRGLVSSRQSGAIDDSSPSHGASFAGPTGEGR